MFIIGQSESEIKWQNLRVARGREEHADAPSNPHVDNMGVENWNIDYLVLTVWEADKNWIYERCLKHEFGELQDIGYGGRGYDKTERAVLGVTIRSHPSKSQDERFTLELPGQACQLLGYGGLSNLYKICLATSQRVTINRIDTAFNRCPFGYKEAKEALMNGLVRSYFKRETIRFEESPFMAREDGKMGANTFYVGGRSSTRFLRGYDLHGYFRLEMEYKHEKANQVGDDILMAGDIREGLKLAMGHLRDYIDFLVDWWQEFIGEYERLYKNLISSVKQLVMKEKVRWLFSQVSASLSLAYDVYGPEVLESFLAVGREKRKNNPSYRAILSAI